jgi:hypothetical protein
MNLGYNGVSVAFEDSWVQCHDFIVPLHFLGLMELVSMDIEGIQRILTDTKSL